MGEKCYKGATEVLQRCSLYKERGAESDLNTPYHEPLKCLSGADFSNLGCLPAGGPGRQAGRRKNIEWGRPDPKASEEP